MPENQPHSAKKSVRLGRGLGSLFGDIENDNALPGARAETQQTTARAETPPVSPAVRARMESAPVAAKPVAEESQIWNIPIDRLQANSQQPRKTFTPEALKELTQSIKEKGILQPITARRLGERQFEIIAGERRWRAAQAAGLHEVPVILKKVSEQDSLELAIIENIQRENLNPMEEAEALEHLMTEYDLTQQEMADKIGKERSSIANSLRLMALAPDVKAFLRKGEISTGHAKVLLGIEDQAQQTALAKQVVSGKLSVRATEGLAAKVGKIKVKPASSINLDVSRRLIDGLALEMQKLIGTKVTIDYADAKGKLAIHFYSDEQLTQMVEKLREAWEK